MRGQDAQKRSVPVDEWGRLNSAKSGRRRDMTVDGKERIGVHISDKYRFSSAHRSATGGFVLGPHGSEVLEKVQSKTPLDNDCQVTSLWVDELNIPHFCTVHFERDSEESVQFISEHR
jgi:hypothetical protein